MLPTSSASAASCGKPPVPLDEIDELKMMREVAAAADGSSSGQASQRSAAKTASTIPANDTRSSAALDSVTARTQADATRGRRADTPATEQDEEPERSRAPSRSRVRRGHGSDEHRDRGHGHRLGHRQTCRSRSPPEVRPLRDDARLTRRLWRHPSTLRAGDGVAQRRSVASLPVNRPSGYFAWTSMSE